MSVPLVGTDRVDTSEELCRYLAGRLDAEDHLEVVQVLEGADDPDPDRAALDVFEHRCGDTVFDCSQWGRARDQHRRHTVRPGQRGGRRPDRRGARPAHTDRAVIFGSVAYALLERTEGPVVLVPLADPDGAEAYPKQNLTDM